jgi:hypothetical protein
MLYGKSLAIIVYSRFQLSTYFQSTFSLSCKIMLLCLPLYSTSIIGLSKPPAMLIGSFWCNNNFVNYDKSFVKQPFGFSVACSMRNIIFPCNINNGFRMVHDRISLRLSYTETSEIYEINYLCHSLYRKRLCVIPFIVCSLAFSAFAGSVWLSLISFIAF